MYAWNTGTISDLYCGDRSSNPGSHIFLNLKKARFNKKTFLFNGTGHSDGNHKARESSDQLSGSDDPKPKQ